MKVVFTGSHGVGKTTLLNELIPLVRTHEDFAVKKAHGFDFLTKSSVLEYDFKYRIFEGIGRKIHKKNWSEKNKQRYFNWWYVYNHYVYRNFIASRAIYDTFAYSRLNIGLNFNRQLFAWATKHIHYDYVFYVPIEFPLEKDGVRYEDTEYQILHDRETQLILEYNHIPYHTISGNLVQRLNQIRTILDV